MSRAPTREERIEIRRVLRNQAARKVEPSKLRPTECLWPHACFDCRKAWKLTVESTARCPQCAADLRWMGRAFKAPKKRDDEQWAKVRALWDAGYRFFNHTGWREPAPFPERLSEVEDFVRLNPDHPFRVER